MQKMGRKKIPWRNSIQTKQAIGFAIIITLILVITSFLQMQAVNLAIGITYEKMNAQAEYFLESFDNEINHIRGQQIEFFHDRKLPFLVSQEIQMSDYEKRDALLSIQERIVSIVQTSDLIKDGVLYLPKSGYQIRSGQIRTLKESDQGYLEKYAGCMEGQIYYDENEFYIVETGVRRVKEGVVPNYLFIITLSPEEMIHTMEALNTSEGNGAFFYRDKENLFLENSNGKPVGKAIYAALEKENTGEYRSIQRVQVDGEKYLVLIGGAGTIGLFVQYTKEAPIMQSIDQFRVYIGLLIVAIIGMAVLFIWYTRKIIHRPMHILLEAFDEVKSGNWSQPIQHRAEDEFGYLYEGFNEMQNQIRRLIDEVYVQENLAQRAQMKQLQAQINPHFLYNSFFVLSRRVKRHDYENAQELAQHLGTYFQYLTRGESDYVTLRQEFEHARSYAAIQGTRFISRMVIVFDDVPENWAGFMVPRLILQPILENVFEHGLKNKVKDGILKISTRQQEGNLLVEVEDNGDEVEDTEIIRMNQLLTDQTEGEITGIRNIHKRLQIYLHGRGGVRIERSDLGGVRVVLFMSEKENSDESEFVNRG